MIDITPSMIAMSLGGLLTGIFGLAAALSKARHTRPWLAWSTFAAGVIVLAAGFWAGVDQNRAAEAASRQSAQILDLASRNAEMSQHLQRLSSGGDSFCFYHYGNYGDSLTNSVFRILVHVGTYPLYEVTATTLDASAFQDFVASGKRFTFGSLHTFEAREQLGTIHPNDIAQNMFSTNFHFQSDFLPVAVPPRANRQEYSLVFAARNGIWIEDVVIAPVNGRLLTAFRVRTPKSDKILYEHIDNGFPLAQNGSVEWNKPGPVASVP
jgi:hypothetical protein